MSYMQLNYHYVEFIESGTNDIVHQSWLVGHGFCRWPPGEITDVKNLVQNGKEPEDDWDIFKIKIKRSSGIVKFTKTMYT